MFSAAWQLRAKGKNKIAHKGSCRTLAPVATGLPQGYCGAEWLQTKLGGDHETD